MIDLEEPAKRRDGSRMAVSRRWLAGEYLTDVNRLIGPIRDALANGDARGARSLLITLSNDVAMAIRHVSAYEANE